MQKSELAMKIVETAQLRGSFELRSGQISDTYFDKHRFEADPALLAEIAFQIETIPTGKKIAWVQFEYRFELTKGIERERRLAAAAAVGGGGSP